MKSRFQRYTTGAYREVWLELFRLGNGVRNFDVVEDATAVANETMSRVKTNVDVLLTRLSEIGCVRGEGMYGCKPRHFLGSVIPPSADTTRLVDELELRAGSIPLSLRAFWELIGGVNLQHAHPLITAYSDPLIVFPVDDVIRQFKKWRATCDSDGDDETGPFAIAISPDVYHKDEVSGGPPYSIVPSSEMDGFVRNEPHGMLFVEYLRTCFANAGFGGFGLQAGPLPPIFKRIAEDLLPF